MIKDEYDFKRKGGDMGYGEIDWDFGCWSGRRKYC